jgi:hypothetical protein
MGRIQRLLRFGGVFVIDLKAIGLRVGHMPFFLLSIRMLIFRMVGERLPQPKRENIRRL